jgi:hypothetical protein
MIEKVQITGMRIEVGIKDILEKYGAINVPTIKKTIFAKNNDIMNA